MMITRKYVMIASLFAVAFTNGQEDKKLKKAEDKFEARSYADAIKSYEDLVEEGYNSEEIFKSLGNANYLNAKYEMAAEWYGKLLELEVSEIDSDAVYRYAQSLKSSGKYEESNQWMQKFNAMDNTDRRSILFSDNFDYLTSISKNSGRYDVKNLPINSAASDFAPSMNGEELVFSTARDTGRIIRSIHKWNNKSFLNLYTVAPSDNGDFLNPTKLSTELNKKTHESSTAFTKDGTMVYFTRNNSRNGKFSRDDQGVSRLKIFRATLEKGQWTDIIELPFNGDNYSVAHPTLSADEKKLYFASDMAGTVGSSDIFYVDIMEDGTYGTPKNLGPQINTEARETFPFVTETNVLYFASDGHPGLGGLDIFAAKIDDMDNLYIVNIGEPVNGRQDDFSFVIDESIKRGFFASNRDGGQGSDDIYGFTETAELDLTCKVLVDGIVTDKNTGETLAGATVTLFDDKGGVLTEIVSTSSGEFLLMGRCKEGDYKVVAQIEGFDSGNTTYQVVCSEYIGDMNITLEKTIKRAAVGIDLVQFLKLSPVYFDLDKSNIRTTSETTMKKVAQYMDMFPDLIIEIRSHTDVKAGSNYNKRLSERRVKETREYLIDLGIDESRLTGKGYGESSLTNDCTSREKCDDAGHQLNRRSEFIVLK